MKKMTRVLRFALVTLCMLSPLSARAQSRSATAQSLLGVWELVSSEDRDASGDISYWLGPHPTGTITYSSSGRMAVQFMRDPRPVVSTPNAWQGLRPSPAVTEDELRGILSGYYAYFGTYDVDESRHAVLHHVKASLRPSEVGLDYVRPFELDGDNLILRYPAAIDGRPTTRTIKWIRTQEIR